MKNVYGYQGESLVPAYTRGSVSLYDGVRGSLVPPHIRGSVSLSLSLDHGGQGKSQVPPYTRGSVFLYRCLSLRSMPAYSVE